MWDINTIKRIYFIGIGGIGMSALAKYFKAKGIEVSGYDKTPSYVTEQLKALNIPVFFDDNISLLPESIDMVIYTPAIPKTHLQFNYLKEKNILIKKRAEVLGLISKGIFTIAVAGTHGKTTTTSIISHILKCAKVDFMSFMGGISKNYDSNFLMGQKNEIIVLEADEFDRSFLNIYPDISVISAMDADHLDIYGTHENMIVSYNQFISQIKDDGTLIIKFASLKYLKGQPANTISFSLNSDSNYKAENIRVREGSYIFNIISKGNKSIEDIRLNLGGRHNIENTVAAVAACKLLGITDEAIKKAIANYSGVMRRFDVRIKHDKLIYIDDYAHHPEELKTLILSVKELYPSKKVTGVFQPHLYTRTRDFAKEFVKVLDILDDIILLDIYPARELPIEGINSQMLIDKISNKNKMLCSKENLIQELLKRKTDIILTIGAGDIDALVEPIEKSFKNILKYMA